MYMIDDLFYPFLCFSVYNMGNDHKYILKIPFIYC